MVGSFGCVGDAGGKLLGRNDEVPCDRPVQPFGRRKETVGRKQGQNTDKESWMEEILKTGR